MLANVHFVVRLKPNRVRMPVAKDISEIDGPGSYQRAIHVQPTAL